MANWKRPDSVPYPQIWRRFVGNKIVDGVKRDYWIQDITEEHYEQIVKYMCNEFLADEPISKYSFFCKDETAVKEMGHLWREILKQRMGLICLTKDKSGVTQIAGVNCTLAAHKDDPTFDCSDKPVNYQRIVELVNFITKTKDCYAEFGIDAYLSAMGLYVPPSYRGEGIGLELLKSRRDLSNAVGLKASLTVFTSIVSQKLAYKAGFQDFVEHTYDELEKINPLFSFPGITTFTKSAKYMVIIY